LGADCGDSVLTMTHWHFPTELNIPSDLLEYVGSPLLARLLCQRGIMTVAQARPFLEPSLYQPASAFDLPDLDVAVQRLQQAIERQELIGVWGDFDVDGQTSTTLLVSMLEHAGARVMYYIPDRMTESHGIKRPALSRMIAQGVQLIVTCDTGIAEHEQIAFAQAQGVEVIVTDHHDLSETLPPSLAAINPKRLAETHPLRELPGVGVAYKLAEALTSPEWAEELLDLVALGIVADVARQVGDTRYLLQRGLTVLTGTRRLGLQLLLENSRLQVDQLTAEHIGFWLGPRLNALGRLGNANLAVELLTTTDLSRARILATQIEGMNDQRKLLVEQVTAAALLQIEQTPSLAEYNALVLAGHNWHPGVIGIAASRLVEQFGKPTILITLSSGITGDEQRPKMVGSGAFVGGNLKGSLLGRGSARSVAGCDIHEAIKTQADLLLSFGGHPMAAGLALPAENLSSFRRGLSEALEGCQASSEKVMTIDAVVNLAEVDMALLQTIQRLAPFGQGNPAITFACREVELVSESAFGKQGGHKQVTLRDKAGTEQEFIWWQGARENTPTGLFDVAFQLGADDFHGGDSIQLVWRGARQESAPTVISTKPILIDWRHEPNIEAKLAEAQLNMVWGEGVSA
jgi:single-stranded-DNA-specific exonuclease